MMVEWMKTPCIEIIEFILINQFSNVARSLIHVESLKGPPRAFLGLNGFFDILADLSPN